MNLLLSGVVGATLILNIARAATNEVQTTGTTVLQTGSGEKEYAALAAEDEAAQAEVERWRLENKERLAQGRGMPAAELERRVSERMAPIGRAYLEFIRRHPKHATAHLAYGCFLNDRQDEAGAQAQWEQALALDPGNADVYHNLAGRYSEIGPSRKAFEFFAKAIKLKPAEPVYYHDFADALYVLRSHAMTNYGLSEQQVFSKALLLYSNAARLEPTNSTFAWDFAQTFYALKPLPYEQALRAWTNALASAPAEADREGVYLHLARVKMLAGRLAEARAQLNLVTNESTAKSKAALLRAIEER